VRLWTVILLIFCDMLRLSTDSVEIFNRDPLLCTAGKQHMTGGFCSSRCTPMIGELLETAFSVCSTWRLPLPAPPQQICNCLKAKKNLNCYLGVNPMPRVITGLPCSSRK
jgi:hypothetical protein